MPATLGYWNIRGLVQPIRLLLKYVGEEYEEVLYKLGEGPEFSRDEWFSVKFTLDLDFPNLPYFIDGDLKLSQTNTILRYLARKHKLYGENEKEQAFIDLLLDEIVDLRYGFAHLCYSPDYDEKKKEKYVEQIKPKLEQLEKFLADKKFFIGDKVTACDFHIYEILDVFKVFEPKLLEDRPKLTEYHERFEELPAIKITACDFQIYETLDILETFEPKLLEDRPKLTDYQTRFRELPAIKAYMNSESFISRPIHAKNAHFY